MSTWRTYILTCDGKDGRCDKYYQAVGSGAEVSTLENMGAVRAKARHNGWVHVRRPRPNRSGPAYSLEFCNSCAANELTDDEQ